MELTWMLNSPQAPGRKRAYRACAWCQRRKKRCQHSNDQSLPVRTYQRRPGGRPTAVPPSTGVFGRFVGEMNPEAVIRDRLHRGSDTGLWHERVGLWIPFSADESRQGSSRERPLAGNGLAPEEQAASDIQTSQKIEESIRRRFQSVQKACMPLPPETRASLFAIYFTQVNHILPIVEGESNVVSPLLERAICLVAAKTPAAAAHLYLSVNGPLVSPRVFCSEIYRGLHDALTEGLEPDRTTRIRVLALMSLHVEDSDGSETASMHLAQAVNQAQTVGMHLRQSGNEEPAYSKLFWCLWSLDKLLASMFGRPCHLRDDDISLKRPLSVLPSHRGPRTPFDIWLMISALLSDAIHFYRPDTNSAHALGKEFPTFQELVGPETEDSDFATLSVLELYHHAVGIVFHRLAESPRLESNNLAHIQRGFAAIRIQSIVATECQQALPPLPVIPYAISLAVSVLYQQYRSSKLITQQARFAADLEVCCNLLEEQRIWWYSAEVMARLSNKALQQIRESNLIIDPAKRRLAPQHTSWVLPQGFQGSKLPETVKSTHPVSCAVSAGGPQSVEAQREPGLQCAAAVEHYNAGEMEDWGVDNMADLDTVFDEFLDLSLPMNF
ncbi:hypothetical protein BDW74DRAFT_102307 [Aspergillus multicolor]|uniref:fungal specific transcription factor domain-containing protein n=1 Tax=Aspergillus multicolor TaxID=41759 RepID=UPI003CCCB25B